MIERTLAIIKPDATGRHQSGAILQRYEQAGLVPVAMKLVRLTKAQAGALGSVTLLGGAVGGLVFGHVADRYGRTRALIASVLIYSVFTAACGLSATLWQFALFRALLGLGMGGEWASGAALVAETWPSTLRGRALGFMQSAWAIGFAAAAVVVGVVLPRWGWRAGFCARTKSGSGRNPARSTMA